MERNLKVWKDSKVVQVYLNYNEIQPPEKTIFDELFLENKGYSILDIGIGVGRTTAFLSKRCSRYLGLDYSSEMIRQCKKKFTDEKTNFKVFDVRNIADLEDKNFEIILYSFNGIDYINYEERVNVLKSIKNSFARGTNFIFSTHNTRNIQEQFKLNTSKNIFLQWHYFTKFLKIRIYNLKTIFSNLYAKKHVLLRDSAHGFGLETIYIKPTFQFRELKRIGFEKVRIFSLENGSEVKDAELEKLKDPWLYYWCKVP